ncbi:unnamed protein product [Trichobilharzia regenti]|nr:unnamed protein product [Trichobilharzia regenti]
MFKAVTMKYLSLFILVFQNLLYILCMRHARSRTTERNPLDVLMNFIPAIIYVIQNRFLIAALSNLDAVTFQVAYQLKLFTTALFSMLILRKPVSTMQWFALVLLFIGVAAVESPGDSKTSTLQPAAHNPPLGLFCVVCASILSGLGCVFFEMVSYLNEF